jgi:uncharacterized protein
MEQQQDSSPIPQYSLGHILLIWAAAALPMGLLGWVVAPAVARNPAQPGFERIAVLTVGLVWQFVLVLLLLARETGGLRWFTVRQRLWLTPPRSPRTGEPRGWLWWWLLPLLLLAALYEMQGRAIVNQGWAALFPFLAELPGFSLGAALATPEARAELVGAWGVYALFLVQALFNTFLGEELLFRGFLLPRMGGVFGRWDWVMNGLLFGLYHLHQPWSLLSSALSGMVLYAWPSRSFRSAWFGILAHSGGAIFLAILLLGLVLGWA